MTTTVWYTGPSLQRKIRVSEWSAAGVTGVEETMWEPLNGWAVDQSTLTQDQIDLLDSEPDFLVNQTGPRAGSFPFVVEQSILNSSVYYVASRELYEKFLTESEYTPGILAQATGRAIALSIVFS